MELEGLEIEEEPGGGGEKETLRHSSRGCAGKKVNYVKNAHVFANLASAHAFKYFYYQVRSFQKGKIRNFQLFFRQSETRQESLREKKIRDIDDFRISKRSACHPKAIDC